MREGAAMRVIETKGSVRKLAYAPCGPTLFFAERDRTSREWLLHWHDIGGSSDVRLEKRSPSTTAICPALQVNRIAIWDHNEGIAVYSTENPRLSTLAAYECEIAANSPLDLSIDGRYLAWCRDAVDDGQVRRQIILHEIAGDGERYFFAYEECRSLCFSPDGTYVVSACNQYVTLWNVKTNESVATCRIPVASSDWFVDGVEQIALFSTDAKLVFIVGRRYLHAWNPVADQLRTFPNAFWKQSKTVAFSHDGRFVAISAKGSVELREIHTSRRVRTYQWPVEHIHCMAFSPDGTTMAAGANQKIVIWDLDDI